MPTPGVIQLEEAVIGKTFTPAYQLLDADGNPLDLSVATVDVEWRLTLADGSDVIVKKKSNGAFDYAFLDDGTDGWIRFFIEDDEDPALVEGLAALEIIYKDSATVPVTNVVWGVGQVKCVASKTPDIP